MDELETYVSNDLRDDEAIINELERSIAETLEFFGKIDFDTSEGKGTLWPYWVMDEDRRKRTTASRDRPFELSQSTISMILAGLISAIRLPPVRVSSGYQAARNTGEVPARCSAVLQQRMEAATTAMVARWWEAKTGKSTRRKVANSEGAPLAAQPGLQVRTQSNTFGPNDILTISWHLDIFNPESPVPSIEAEQQRALYESAKEIVVRRLRDYAQAENGYRGILKAFNDDVQHRERMVSDSSYNLLRFARCFKAVEVDLGQDADLVSTQNRAFTRFRNKLHEQLSLWEVLDSQFDPSELAYCLEGMLQLRPDTVNNALFDRVVGVLEKSQEMKPSWSTDMPITADRKGQVLFPISVEIPRSILASIAAFDRYNAAKSFYGSAGSRALHLVKRYWRWLNTRRTTITTASGERVTGWLSEQINAAMILHTWESSQILDFCVAYRDQLRHHISRKLLLASRLQVRWPAARGDTWGEIITKYEPARCEHVTQVYKDIGTYFVEPHSQGASGRLWSMLLYGPPGTGKSDLAENLAGFLGLPLITVTVSDFLGEGEARMENRAKLLFEVLTRQTTSVVLFDELDQFLLDRDSDRFREQETVFQFLTPGMLTKLAGLRKRANVLFIIATNYEDRIDAAIKRTGRIDRKFLLLPPDSKRRLAILETFSKVAEHVLAADEGVRREISMASAFLGYMDLQQLANEEWNGMDDFIERLDRAARNIQLFSYKARFAMPDKTRPDEVDVMAGPYQELVDMIILARDAWGDKFERWEYARQFSTAILGNILRRALNRQVFLRKLDKLGIELAVD